MKGNLTLGGPLLLSIVTGAALVAALAFLPSPEAEITGFVTPLGGRSGAQRHNAVLSADALDGRVIAPGATFSFNRAVRSWSLDQGYVKAPVSFDGELVAAFGGGVCQTSTTLYNAALLAGLPIVERHHHVFAPHYVAPGRDAAVAYPSLDLRFRNPYSFPLRIRANARGDRLAVTLWGARPADTAEVRIESQVLAHARPERVTVDAMSARGGTYKRNPGTAGYRVVTYRILRPPNADGAAHRERLSDDSYPAMDRVVTLAQ